MHKSTRRLALAASAVLAITAAAGAAMAQMPPPPPPPPALPPLPPLPPMDAMMMGGHDMAMRHHGKPADPEAHAKHLRDVLQLRPDQDGALKTYIEATAPQKMADAMMWDSKDDGDDKPLTKPERLDRQAAHMTKMAETFQKRASATKAFYAALSPSQQKAFDALAPHGPRMMVKHLDIRHDGPPMGERKIIMKPKAG
jgi:protein CpxP